MVRFTFLRSLSLVPLFLTFTHSLPSTPARIPNGENPDLPCMELGHIDCVPGGPRNQFGMDFMAGGSEWTEALCQMDSDGDGITNGAELGDPCCVWREGDGPEQLRPDMLSNPGDPESTDAAEAPECPPGGAPAPADAPAASPEVAAPTGGADATPMGTPMLMGASPVPTGVTEDMDFDENPFMSASPVPTGIFPADEVMPTPGAGGAPIVPDVTGAPEDEIDPTPTPNIVDNILEAAACFPAEATVTLKDGSKVAMKDVKVGDEILAKFPDTFSQIYMFSHKEESSVNDFVKIAAANGFSITASPGHYIVVDGKLKAAAAVVAGDKLTTETGDSEVVSVEAVKMTGLYNPHTLAGSVVVDGVLSSDVTTAVKPSVARTLLAPFKFMYQVFQRDVSGGLLNNGAGILAQLAPVGAKEL